ncbi:MAG: hypothetical protein U0836_15295 [Pirellulales bacterium]
MKSESDPVLDEIIERLKGIERQVRAIKLTLFASVAAMIVVGCGLWVWFF